MKFLLLSAAAVTLLSTATADPAAPSNPGSPATPTATDPAARIAKLNEWFLRSGPKAGEAAPDFKLAVTEGGMVQASALWSRKLLLVTTGSYSCPQFRGNVPDEIALEREFGGQLNSAIVYTIEAHPADGPSPYNPAPYVPEENKKEGIMLPKPKTYVERIGLAQRCQQALHLAAVVAVDGMDDAVWKAYGGSPNCAYLIDTTGKVIFRQGLFDPAEMRAEIAKVLGASKPGRLSGTLPR